jgi:hypothetical protein
MWGQAVRGDDDEGDFDALAVDVDHWVGRVSGTGLREVMAREVDLRVLPGGEYRNSWLPSKA